MKLCTSEYVCTMCCANLEQVFLVQVEIHEEGVLAVILQEADPQHVVQCGTALALICDPADVSEIQRASQSGSDISQHANRETAWQAFIAS